MKTKFNILILILFFCSNALLGQERHGGAPLMFDIEKNNLNGLRFANAIPIERKVFPVIDNERELKRADSIALSSGYGRNKFYGMSVPVNLDFKQAATVETVGDSGKVYLLELSSPTAYALQVYFDAFKIPKGSRMFVYDSDKTMFLGSFTHRNNFINNRFGTEFVKGNSLIIEYYEPNEVEFEAQPHIERLVHTFMDLRHGPFSWNNPHSSTGRGAAPCNINVRCSLGYGWDREIRSVAIILGELRLAGSPTIYNGFCSGAVINNTAQDGRPFFLTANHCLGPPMGNTFDWIFLFNHETQNCSDDGSNVSSYLGQSVYGALKLAADGSCSPTSDYLLLELNTFATTLANYGVVYAGWEANESKAVNSSYTVGIHHPSGDVKKISVDKHPPISVSGILGCQNGAQNHWQVSWDEGITEGGSSGSPLFNSDHKIIGLLHGGSSYCHAPNAPDIYGKFSTAFREGSLSFWLDPYFSGATSIGPYNPSQINENCYNGIQDGTETGIDCGGNCPPCGWTSPIGGGAGHCHNGVKDGDETGIDCGGSCRPCGGAAQCSNCKQDGDETGIDCGGSCPPCKTDCISQANVVYNNTHENLPSNTISKNSITTISNVDVLPNQNVAFKAGDEIILNQGFRAYAGSTFSAVIAPCDCKQPCAVLTPNAFTPNGNEYNWLVYFVSGYNRFSVIVEPTHWTQGTGTIYQSSGTISGNHAFIWDGTGSGKGSGAYAVQTTLYSDCLGISKKITHIVNVLKTVDFSDDSEEYFKEMLTDVKLNDMPEEIKIYPNPAREFLTIQYPYHDDPIVYIVNESGKVVYLKKDVGMDCGTLNVNVSSFASGVYIIKIIRDGEVFVEKFIKN